MTVTEITEAKKPASIDANAIATQDEAIKQVEAYLRRYMAFSTDVYALPLALWAAGTHAYETFDAYGYLVITAATKRAGKTRLMELLSFVAARARHVADITPAALFTMVEEEMPTLMVDEAGKFAASQKDFRAIINSGYRRGGTVTRRQGRDIHHYRVYCPKVFVLIGDVYDTLRDRSIVINLRRAHSPHRFIYTEAQTEGWALRDRLTELLTVRAEQIIDAYVDLGRFDFLSDREEEIWSPLFAICRVICPDRWDELVRAAVDISTAKTAEARKHTDLPEYEDAAQQIEYGERALRDLIHIIEKRRRKSISTTDAILALRELPTGPWRAFRGEGLKPGIEGSMMLASLLEPFSVRPRTIRIRPKSQGASGSTAKGYVLSELMEAARKTGCFPDNGQPVSLPTILVRKPFTGRVPRIRYPGAKGGLAKAIVRFMPPVGHLYVEPSAGKGNVFWAAATDLRYEEWWINDLQTAPFFEALRDIGNSIVVPPFSPEEFVRQKAAFARGDREAILIEPYFTFSGCGFDFSGPKGKRLHQSTPLGYQRELRSCNRILHQTNPRITAMDFKDMHLEELGPDDFVYFDLPYWSGNVQTYSKDTVDFPYLFRLLEKARFRWLLSEYPERMFFEHFGDPCFVQEVRLLCTRVGEEQVRTECLWKNY